MRYEMACRYKIEYIVIIIGLLVDDVQTDTHYAILSVLLLLANSPTKAEYQPPTASKFTGMFNIRRHGG